MGYYDYDDEPAPEPAPERSVLGWAQQFLGLLVRLLGLGMLLVGLWAGISVILEGWALYQNPERIERFADAVERASGLDSVFASAVAEGADTEGEDEGVVDGLRLSYFIAWFLALLLLFVIGMIAMSAVSTGGRVALHDDGSRKITREMLREVRRMRRAA